MGNCQRWNCLYYYIWYIHITYANEYMYNCECTPHIRAYCLQTSNMAWWHPNNSHTDYFVCLLLILRHQQSFIEEMNIAEYSITYCHKMSSLLRTESATKKITASKTKIRWKSSFVLQVKVHSELRNGAHSIYW